MNKRENLTEKDGVNNIPVLKKKEFLPEENENTKKVDYIITEIKQT